MFAYRGDAWGRNYVSEAGLLASATQAEMAAGLMAGTQIATQIGWRDVAAVAVGDQVMTFDGGMQAVAAVTRQMLTTDGEMAREEEWLVFVPAGALGNRNDMTLLPQQAVMIEADAAEEAFGDPFAMIPASALVGFRQITRVPPADQIEIVTLVFAQDQVIFAQGGALLFCQESHELIDAALSDYRILDVQTAHLLVNTMICDDLAASAAPLCKVAA